MTARVSDVATLVDAVRADADVDASAHRASVHTQVQR
jgi:hypothetical protein